MYPDHELLRLISQETMNSIGGLSIVTPSIYSSLFFKHAQEHSVEISDEANIADDELNEKISHLTNLNNQTSKNMQQLSESTTKAINAIQAKDEAMLSEALSETKTLRKEIEKLRASVYKDELTGAYNRKWLHDTFLDGDSKCFKYAGTLAIVDLNYFKIVNDTFGHIVGDKVLAYIADTLKRADENVIRYGGDEFVILFSETVSEVEALNKLTSLRESILSKRFKVQDATFKPSFSFGVHMFQAWDNLNDVIESADKNMYNDKIAIKQRITGIEIGK